MSEWKTYKLGDVVDIGSSKRIFYKEYVDSGIPFYRSKEVIEKYKGNKVSTELFITQEKFTELKEKFGVPNKDDILLTSVGTLGIPYVVKEEDEFYFKDGNLTWFKNYTNHILSLYLYYWIISPIGKNELEMSSIGSTQAALTIKGLKALDISLPPLEEQNAIAEVLSSLDDKIDLLHRQNRTLEAMAQTLFRQWFIEDVDEGWKEGSVEDIAILKSGKSRPKEEAEINLIPIYGGNGILGYTNRFNAEDESIIIGRVGAYCGSLYLENQPIWVSDNALLAKVKDPIYTKFLFYILKNNELNSMAEGSSHPLLTQGLIKSIPIIIPSNEKLNAFNNQVNTWYEKINFNKQQINTLENIRDTLLPKLMSGEVRVKI